MANKGNNITVNCLPLAFTEARKVLSDAGHDRSRQPVLNVNLNRHPCVGRSKLLRFTIRHIISEVREKWTGG